MNSIISYPNRGHYGKSNYRGNCSGHVIKDLIEHFNPADFVDATLGGRTSEDVCRELGIPFMGLDLHNGFDGTRHSIYKAIGNRQTAMSFSHFPYWNMIDYIMERKKHNLQTIEGNDLSACKTVEEFLEMSQVMLLNQRHATRSGGIYATLIGDYRKSGKFYSFQADYQAMMPRHELKSVVIKQQHNVMSATRSYGGNFIPICHEYLLVWEKSKQSMVQVIYDKAKELKNFIQGTWRNLVRIALMNLNGESALSKIYREIEKIGGDKLATNKNWQAKVRQTLQRHFSNVERGVWGLA